MPSAPLQRRRLTKRRLKRNDCFKCTKIILAGLPTIVFGFFTLIFTIQQDSAARATREQDQRNSDELTRRTIFKEYIDDMKGLLLHENFQQRLNQSLLQIRVQTLTVLKVLDSNRKRDIVRFLYENRLIRYDLAPTIDLRGADLNGMKFIKSATESCDFAFLFLPGIYGEKMFFDGCSLLGAIFTGASMAGAQFHSSNMISVSLSMANLTHSVFEGCHLYRSNFSSALLSHSSIINGFFQKVDLTNADLYESNIAERLLFPPETNRLAINRILNTRFPNGSFSEIDKRNVIQNDQAPVDVRAFLLYFYDNTKIFSDFQCVYRSTVSWDLRLTEDSRENSFDETKRSPSLEHVNGKCYIRVDKETSVFQNIDLERYSLLIDMNKAIINVSIVVGMNSMTKHGTIHLILYFLEDKGATEYSNSVIS